jgi:nicotinamidase-related amidase
MSTLTDRPNTAVLVIDVQNSVVANAFRRDEVISSINAVIDKARAAGVPVIWVQHSDDELVQDSDDWQYVAELQRAGAEPVVHKHYNDSFEETTLESELAQRGIGHVVVTGAETDACVRATIHGALVRGYDTTLVGDAHTTNDYTSYGMPSPDLVIAHTNGYWQFQSSPGRSTAVVHAADVSFDAS